MCLEPLPHPVGVTLGLELVLAELVLDLRVLSRPDHRLEHPQNVLLHRVGLVDVLDELFLQLFRSHFSSCLDPFELDPDPVEVEHSD